MPTPPAKQMLPKQEPGLRRSRALPYELQVQGQWRAASRTFAIELSNSGKAGAAFLVSQPGSPDAPRTYTVEAGKSLSDAWTLAADQPAYDVLVSGPNGFSRRFKGEAKGSTGSFATEVKCAHDRHRDNRLRLTLTNKGTAPVRLKVSANAYPVCLPRTYVLAPGAKVEDYWHLSGSFGWYDLSVTAEGHASFLRRVAGRLETGAPSISDPAIGRV
jgi:phospholipase C